LSAKFAFLSLSRLLVLHLKYGEMADAREKFIILSLSLSLSLSLFLSLSLPLSSYLMPTPLTLKTSSTIFLACQFKQAYTGGLN
jgi:hypothetical protein